MYKLVAIIRPYLIDEVRDSLADIGLQGLTVSDVKGFGRQKGQTEIYRGAEYSMDFVPKIMLEVLLNDQDLEACVETITTVVNTGKLGDGKIFISRIQQVIRIRTDETDEQAL